MQEKDFKNEALDVAKLAPILKAKYQPKLDANANSKGKMVVVFSRHRYYRHLVVELATAEISKNGSLKNPLNFLDPLDLVWKSDHQAELKFYSGISRFRNN